MKQNQTKKEKENKKRAKGEIIKISGPVVFAKEVPNATINDVVKVGNEELLGEIIELRGPISVIQVYEETDGLKPGEPIINTNKPLSVELGPGILTSVYDGIQRPLKKIIEESGNFIARGIYVPALDEKKKWQFKATKKKGDQVNEGKTLGEVPETTLITHKILVPPGIKGTITKISSGKYTVNDTIATITDENGKETEIRMKQIWPVRKARPYKEKLNPGVPLITGQRVYDVFFPLVKGGAGAIPGPFGCGKTVTQQQIAKWCDAQIIVYIGCGERGNEMTEVLVEFPHLKDPKSGKPLMDRTVLIANTSNMPFAAREASVYTGVTIAEYFRDQGYDVALMADSTSRWAEAMREISGRLEEMPGEEGYPAYLASKLAAFYERSGRVRTLNGDVGSVTIIGAVSPPGGDFSEPVTQNTLKIVKVFWALDAKLAAKRHYWAINWLDSYSLYTDVTDNWYDQEIGEGWSETRKLLMNLLQKEAELQEIVQLVGKDTLPEEEQFILLVTKFIREDILQQNAFDENDTYCPVEKQLAMIKMIKLFYETGLSKVKKGEIKVKDLERSEITELIGRMKYADNKKYKEYFKKIEEKIKKLN